MAGRVLKGGRTSIIGLETGEQCTFRMAKSPVGKERCALLHEKGGPSSLTMVVLISIHNNEAKLCIFVSPLRGQHEPENDRTRGGVRRGRFMG